MKAWKALSLVSLVLVWSAAALAQDPVKVDPAHYRVVFENASVRVLKIGYAPGAKSSMHQHPDAIVVPLAATKVRFALPEGKSEVSELANESAMYTPAGTHNPENVGSGPVDALLIEFKTAAPGKAALPASRPGVDVKVLAEGPRAMAYRSTTLKASSTLPSTASAPTDTLSKVSSEARSASWVG
jgi:quercetin dioxygenase-like cupin family protein